MNIDWKITEQESQQEMVRGDRRWHININAFSRYKSASAKMLDSLESIYDAENDELTI